MSSCNLCPRQCGADRASGKLGFCGATENVKIARIAPHFWEEPCISGKNGSGAIFFSGCTLRCIYCQNAKISRFCGGKEYSVDRLAEEIKKLEQSGVHNINLVTPTHYIPQIASALDIAKPHIPVVYNTSGYEKPESLSMLANKVQIFLPDYKYDSPALAKKYSSAEDYPEVALMAIGEMVKLAGKPTFDAEGMMTGGVIVRHLVLPGCTDDSMKALKRLHKTFGNSIFISIMNQYTPMPNVPDELNRPLSEDEYELVLDYADFLGIENGFRQEGGTVGESFIPDFEI